MRTSPLARALARHAIALSAAALLLAAPARADEPVHSQATPSHTGDARGGLLLLSFLVPLPLPLALVAPPSATRPPVATSREGDRPPAASAAPTARVARRTAR